MDPDVIQYGLWSVAIFPALVAIYWRLVRKEERESLRTFGDAYSQYMAVVPTFIPQLSRLSERPFRKERKR